jgi:hypothetical protein
VDAALNGEPAAPDADPSAGQGACSAHEHEVAAEDAGYVRVDAEHCRIECAGQGPAPTCPALCMERESNVSGACGACFVQYQICFHDACDASCFESEEACTACIEQSGCVEKREACTGSADAAYGVGTGAGAPCSSEADCWHGLVCTVNGTGKCTVPWGRGAPCESDADCGDNVCMPVPGDGPWMLYCGDHVRACKPKLKYSTCSADGYCADENTCSQNSWKCFGGCAGSGLEGGPCDASSSWGAGCQDSTLVCNEALAPGGLCEKPGDVGTWCMDAADCAPGLACTAVGDAAMCRSPSGLDGPCHVSTDCAPELQCDRPSECKVGFCRQPAPIGAPCASPYACGEGLTCVAGPGGSFCALGDKPCEGTWCPDPFVCHVEGGVGWCTALGTSCEDSCPVGYTCWTGPRGLDGSCWELRGYCQIQDHDSYPCDDPCTDWCSRAGNCSLWVDHHIDAVCSQCRPEPRTRLEGAPCYAAEDCAVSLTCIAGSCVKTEVGAPCDASSPWPVCSNDQRCDSGSCQPALELGQACSSSGGCTAGLVCRSPGLSCQPPLSEDDACGPNECAHGLTCNSHGVCAAPARYLEPCDADADCQGGSAPGYQCRHSVCTYPGGDYGPCGGPASCATSTCTPEGYCAPGCDVDAECAEGFRCRASGSCRLPLSSGQPCKDDLDCASETCTGVTECELGTCE